MRREATVAGVFERFGVSIVSSVLAGYRYHNGVFIVWEYTVVLIWFGLAYNTDFCTYGRICSQGLFTESIERESRHFVLPMLFYIIIPNINIFLLIVLDIIILSPPFHIIILNIIILHFLFRDIIRPRLI